MLCVRLLVAETDPSLVRPQTDLFLPDFAIQEVGLFVELLYRGEVGLRTQRQAAPVRHLLRLFNIDLRLEVIAAREAVGAEPPDPHFFFDPMEPKSYFLFGCRFRFVNQGCGSSRNLTVFVGSGNFSPVNAHMYKIF